MHWFYEPQFAKNQLLSAETRKHLSALRISASEPITITDGLGKTWMIRSDAGEVTQLLEASSHEAPTLRFNLIQALAKSDRDELALQASIELGATSITPWKASRSIVKWDGKESRNQERWQTIAIESMKQSQRAFLADVKPLKSTKQLEADGLGIVLDPRAELTLEKLPAARSYSIAVGPEGGIEESEIAILVSAGFKPVRLGAGVLRASSAGPAAIAALQQLHGEFRS